MTALAEAFNNGEETRNVAAHRGGRYGLSSKSSARRAYWRSLMNSAARNPNHGLVGIYDDVTNLSLPLPENTLPAALDLKARCYFTAREGDGSVSPRK